MEDVPSHCEAHIHNLLEVLVGLELPQNEFMGSQPKVLVLYFHQLVQMVLQLSVLQLVEIVWAQDHMLNQLSYFLVEFNHIWLFVHKVLD